MLVAAILAVMARASKTPDLKTLSQLPMGTGLRAQDLGLQELIVALVLQLDLETNLETAKDPGVATGVKAAALLTSTEDLRTRRKAEETEHLEPEITILEMISEDLE